jgi:hypothetical protein
MNVSISFRPILAEVAGAPGTAPARKDISPEHAVLEAGAPKAAEHTGK